MTRRRTRLNARSLAAFGALMCFGAGAARAQVTATDTTSADVASASVGAGTSFSTDTPGGMQVPLSAHVRSGVMPATIPADAPAYLAAFYHSALKAPLPRLVYLQGGIPSEVPQTEWDPDGAGLTATYQPGGATVTATNAFFQSLGSNGRACITCHQPPNGMSVSVPYIQARAVLSGGRDPLFAPVDGANCPSAVASADTSAAPSGGATGRGAVADFIRAHSLLLTRGLFRVFLPVPKGAEYTLSVVQDPYGCNTDPVYDTAVGSDGTTSQIVSVYRRPRMSANLNVLTQTYANTKLFPPIDIYNDDPLPLDPTTGLYQSGNLMADGREPTLESQAIDATLGHAQALKAPTLAQAKQMVAFENGIFAAQAFVAGGGWLDRRGGYGGPAELSSMSLGLVLPGPPAAGSPMNLFAALDTGAPLRAAIARGEALFNSRTFTITGVAGFNNSVGGSAAVTGTCSTCHDQRNSGADGFSRAQRDIGTGGTSAAYGGPAPDPALPIFRVTCNASATTGYHGRVMLTNDPGRALITGKCADVGRITIPQLRALSSRAPYFSNGSAATLLDVTQFYNRRFNIGLSTQEATDLAQFLAAL